MEGACDILATLTDAGSMTDFDLELQLADVEALQAAAAVPNGSLWTGSAASASSAAIGRYIWAVPTTSGSADLQS